MVKGSLIQALDFAKKKGDNAHAQFSYRQGEQWYVVKYGPKYSNTYKVLSFDAKGEADLKAMEKQDKPNASGG